jgi:hypothetical protein
MSASSFKHPSSSKTCIQSSLNSLGILDPVLYGRNPAIQSGLRWPSDRALSRAFPTAGNSIVKNEVPLEEERLRMRSKSRALPLVRAFVPEISKRICRYRPCKVPKQLFVIFSS